MRGYADTTFNTRQQKARKIEALLGPVDGKQLLDLGAGSGILSRYFASRGAIVTAADRDASAYDSEARFVEIADPPLPFDDASFDVIVFNHVIEHVGKRPAQDRMIAEISRILRPGGCLYLAAPSSWALVEPHFKLPLLGVIPRSLADALVRISGKGDYYDCFPLHYFEMLRLLERHFGLVTDKTKDAFRFVVDHELGGIMGFLGRAIPGPVIDIFKVAMPTFVFLCWKPRLNK